MAFYPTENYGVLTGKTVAEIEEKTRAAIANGYDVVSDNTLYINKYKNDTHAYTQAVVKKTNTDAQYIAAMYAAFKPALDGIAGQLSTIASRLSTANNKLDQIITNTNQS